LEICLKYSASGSDSLTIFGRLELLAAELFVCFRIRFTSASSVSNSVIVLVIFFSP
jgi:hypothetical protein